MTDEAQRLLLLHFECTISGAMWQAKALQGLAK